MGWCTRGLSKQSLGLDEAADATLVGLGSMRVIILSHRSYRTFVAPSLRHLPSSHAFQKDGEWEEWQAWCTLVYRVSVESRLDSG